MARTPADEPSDFHRSHHEPEPPLANRPAENAMTGTGPAVADDRAARASTPSAADRLEPSAGMISTPTIKRTRISGTWVAVIVAAVVLIFLLVFILQNLTSVTVKFLGLSGSLPLGVAMLFAAIAGAILVALIGTARILQLRQFAKRVGTTRSSLPQRS